MHWRLRISLPQGAGVSFANAFMDTHEGTSGSAWYQPREQNTETDSRHGADAIERTKRNTDAGKPWKPMLEHGHFVQTTEGAEGYINSQSA